MCGENGRPFAVTITAMPVAMNLALRPGMFLRNSQEHLTRVQKTDERAKRTRESAEDKYLLSPFRLFFDVLHGSQDGGMIEEHLPIARKGVA